MSHVGVQDAGSVIDHYLAGDLTEGQGMAVLGLNRLDFRLRVEWREHDLRVRYDALGEAWSAVDALVQYGYYDPRIDRALAAISALRREAVVTTHMAEIIRRHDAGLPHPCPDGGHESHLTEEQREAGAWQRSNTRGSIAE